MGQEKGRKLFIEAPQYAKMTFAFGSNPASLRAAPKSSHFIKTVKAFALCAVLLVASAAINPPQLSSDTKRNLPDNVGAFRAAAAQTTAPAQKKIKVMREIAPKFAKSEFSAFTEKIKVENAVEKTEIKLRALKQTNLFKGVPFKKETIEEAGETFIKAKGEGTVDTVARVANVLPETDSPQILTLAFVESRIGLNETHGHKNMTYAGIVQITNDTFISWIMEHGREAAEKLGSADPKAAKKLRRLLPFIQPNKKGEMELRSRKFRKAYPSSKKSLRREILSLRDNEAISLMLTSLEGESKIPELKEEVLEKKGGGVVKKLVTAGGDTFLHRLVHNFGIDTAKKLLLKASGRKKIQDYIGHEAAANAGFRNVSVEGALRRIALQCIALDHFFERATFRAPKLGAAPTRANPARTAFALASYRK